MALLSSQAVMDLLDEPRFIDEASTIMEELNLSDGESTGTDVSSQQPAGLL